MVPSDDVQDRYLIHRAVLDETARLLAEPGSAGFEAVAVWIGRRVDTHTIQVLHPVRPHQHTVRYEGGGVTVIVPTKAITDLIRQLEQDCFVVARFHSHPDSAYHSEVDDDNMLISHRGAISIVVPNFAQDGLDLTRAAVYQLDGGDWVRLTEHQITQRFVINA